jgi:hypothetical protein
MLGDQLSHHRHHPADNLVLGMVAVGEEGVIGDVDAAEVWPRVDDLAQHRQPAKAGIKDENGGMLRHGD